jgi:hypothetical protein
VLLAGLGGAGEAGWGGAPDGRAADSVREALGVPVSGGAEAVEYFLRKRLQAGMTEYPVEQVRALTARAEASARAAGRATRGDDKGPTEPEFIQSWTALGPGNIGGRTRTIVLHPGDPAVAYAAGVGAGVYRTENFDAENPDGVIWTPVLDRLESGLPQFIDNASIAVTTLALDPADPDTIYAGTGEVLVGFTGAEPNFPRGIRGFGVYKYARTKDNPSLREWKPLDLTPFLFDFVSKVVLSPAPPTEAIPRRIYVATTSGVWRHDNAGDPEDDQGNSYLWSRVLADNSEVGVTDLQIKPSVGAPAPVEEEVLLAALGGAASPDGLFLSINGGDNWFKQVAAGVSDDVLDRIDTPAQGRMTIAFAPSNSDTVYVAMSRNNRIRTTGAGAVPEAALLIPAQGVINIFRANLSPGSLDILTNADGVVLDVQADWEPRLDKSRPLSPVLFSNPGLSLGCSFNAEPRMNRGFFSQALAVDPANPNTLWLGGVDMFRSTDGGRTFGLASHTYLAGVREAEGTTLHEGQHQIVFPEDQPGTLVVTNNAGVFRTRNRDATTVNRPCHSDLPGEPGILPGTLTGIRWESLNNHFISTQFYHGDAGRLKDVVVGGAPSTGVLRSFRRGCTEQWHSIRAGDAGFVRLDPRDNDRIYSTARVDINYFPDRTPSGIIESTVGAPVRSRLDTSENPWTEVLEPITRAWTGALDKFDDPIISNIRFLDEGLFVTPLHLAEWSDGGTPRVALWTGGERPWRMLNPEAPFGDPGIDAPLWELAGDGFPFFAGRISAIASAPSDPNIVWIGTEEGFIFRSTNAMAEDRAEIEWETMWDATQSGFVRAFISSLAIDPDDPEIVYYTSSLFNGTFGFGHIFRRTPFEDPGTGETVFVFIAVDGIDTDFEDETLDYIPDIPTHWISIRRCNDRTQLFLATEIGVFASESAANPDFTVDPKNPNENYLQRIKWTYLNDSPEIGALPRTPVESLAFRDDNTLAAFTFGRGAYYARLAGDIACGQDETPCNAADLVPPFGTLDLNDLLAMINFFNSASQNPVGDPLSNAFFFIDMPDPEGEDDCGDGVLDLNDLVAFVTLFNKDCPEHAER